MNLLKLKNRKEVFAWSLYDFANQGKMILIELSAAWCSPCNDLAKWITTNTKFDRLYFYGDKLPIHVSYSPDHSRQIVTMNKGKSGKLIPKVVKAL